jgi:lipopolysaccharide export system permease protein
VYTLGEVDAKAPGRLARVGIERRGTGPDYPTVVTLATDGTWRGTWWHLREGVIHVIPSDSQVYTFHFAGLRDRAFTESPRTLLKESTQPDEMQRAELQKYIAAMERSGQDVNPTRVDLMLRIAIPVTCLIIFLFGAPLATSNQRGGAAFGVGIALGTTILFLMLVQLTKAVGGQGILSPELAAWIPSMVFALAGVVLLWRVKT